MSPEEKEAWKNYALGVADLLAFWACANLLYVVGRGRGRILQKQVVRWLLRREK